MYVSGLPATASAMIFLRRHHSYDLVQDPMITCKETQCISAKIAAALAVYLS